MSWLDDWFDPSLVDNPPPDSTPSVDTQPYTDPTDGAGSSGYHDPVYDPSGGQGSASVPGWLQNILNGLKTPAGAATGIAGLAGLYDILRPSSNVPRGWQGHINMGLKASRSQIPHDDTNRVPGSAGRQHFTPITYAAQGGIMGAVPPRYLAGPTDGMADGIASNIDGKQEAALSHGEFVVPADVVSHMGNGNSEAGAKQLYSMMDRVRQARTGSKQQGRQIDPQKFMPKGYAGGGAVAFDAGGTIPPVSPSQPVGTTASSNLSPWAGDYIGDYLSKGQALANTPYEAYTGPLTAGPSAIQNQAFSTIQNGGMPAYSPTDFTNQFAAPGAYNPTQFSTGLGSIGSVQDYMSPYMTGVTDAAQQEASRQAAIQSNADNAKLAQAGAFGGSRQAVLQAEGNRNLGTLQNQIYTSGLQSAFDRANQQRLAESGLGLQAQQGTEQSKQFGATQGLQGALGAAQYGQAAQQGNQANQQFGATYGLQSLQNQLAAGATQRDITGQGIAADQAQWAAEQADPYRKLQFQQSLISGLPVGTNTVGATTGSTASQLTNGIGGLTQLYDLLKQMGLG